MGLLRTVLDQIDVLRLKKYIYRCFGGTMDFMSTHLMSMHKRFKGLRIRLYARTKILYQQR